MIPSEKEYCTKRVQDSFLQRAQLIRDCAEKIERRVAEMNSSDQPVSKLSCWLMNDIENMLRNLDFSNIMDDVVDLAKHE